MITNIKTITTRYCISSKCVSHLFVDTEADVHTNQMNNEQNPCNQIMTRTLNRHRNHNTRSSEVKYNEVTKNVYRAKTSIKRCVSKAEAIH